VDNPPTPTVPLPDLFSAKRVLCVQPHYDDNDLFAGGTIARLHDQGATIIYLTVTDDLVGVLDQSLSDEQMTGQLRAEQKQAGALIGVDEFVWMGYPDAGSYDYYQLRQALIGQIRAQRPDFIITVDPYLPYEVHQDHILTGRAVSEAVLLVGFPRLKSDPELDGTFDPRSLQGIAFYNSPWPNLTVDISATTRRKHQAFCAYRAQFTLADLEALDRETDANEREAAKGQPFSHAETLKVLRPAHLHGNPRAWRS
jgi:N,N'-diacetylchitobiose non-reducing end deacetylase